VWLKVRPLAASGRVLEVEVSGPEGAEEDLQVPETDADLLIKQSKIGVQEVGSEK